MEGDVHLKGFLPDSVYSGSLLVPPDYQSSHKVRAWAAAPQSTARAVSKDSSGWVGSFLGPFVLCFNLCSLHCMGAKGAATLLVLRPLTVTGFGNFAAFRELSC